MADKKPSNIMIPPSGGMLRGLIKQLKLITRLMGDRRVGFLLKLLPLASLAYLIWPIDAVPVPVIGALDDAAILWIGSTLFVELCPPSVVKQIRSELESDGDDDDDGDVVDAEATDVNDK